jgi:uncharacterized protein
LSDTGGRIATLDFVRGVAVMGILVANLSAYGLPEAAYFSPLAWGGRSSADVAVWYATFVLVEGKLRGLFTLLFGASMLLVTDAAKAARRDPAQVHLARMAVLFGIGLLHLYLIWRGDILAHYALVGAVAFLFAGLRTRALVALGGVLLVWEMLYNASGAVALFASAARDTPEKVALWNAFAGTFGAPPPGELRAEIAALGGPWPGGVRWRWTHGMDPLTFALLVGPETLSAMLFGMAAYRSGLLTGAWPRERARRWATLCLAVALPAYALLGLNTLAHGFDQRWVFLASVVASAPFRILGALGYAGLLVLLFRPGGRLSERVAAVGRAAFTNYLGTSLVMLAVFTSLGLFGRLTRAELYLLAPPVWLLMLLWSQPWLARYRYGPLEWLWRSLARGELQPIRRGA